MPNQQMRNNGARRNGVSRQEGNVRYPDTSVLNRPLDMPAKVRSGMMAAVIVAALIGGAFLFNYLDGVIGEPKRQQAALEENITREVSLDLPQLSSLMNMDDQSIMSELANADFTLYEKTPVGSSDKGGFEVIKLPSEVSLEEAGLIYLNGVENASPGDAARLLNGSWTLLVDRSSGTSMRVRYADFSSGSADAAIQNAKAAEGLSDVQASDAGVDDAGNTYQAGTIDIDGTTYTWRVSVIPLSEMYSIEGMPETAQFVGVRFTK